MFAPKEHTLSKPTGLGARGAYEQAKKITKELDSYSKRKPRKRGLLSRIFST